MSNCTLLESKLISKQVFPTNNCLPYENSIFLCFILSSWDNIVGPQAVFVWKRKLKCVEKNVQKQNLVSESHITKNSIAIKDNTFLLCDSSDLDSDNINLSSIVKYVCEHSVNIGESRLPKVHEIVSFSMSVPHLGIQVFSIRFHVSEDGVGVPYCLSSVISNINHLSSLLTELHTESLRHIALEMRVLITKNGMKAADRIRKQLIHLNATMTSLEKSNLTHYNIANFVKFPDDRIFAEKMLTSHLQTQGYTIVISSSPSHANKIVMWLGQFVAEDKLEISRISLAQSAWQFHPGLALQAVIRDDCGFIDISTSKFLILGKPVTLIDVDYETVRLLSLETSVKKSSEALRLKLASLWHDVEDPPAPSESLIDAVNEKSSLVRDFFNEHDKLASCEQSVKANYVKLFLRSLQYSALALIEFIDNFHSQFMGDRKSFEKMIKKNFDWSATDFKIILAFADEIRPGIAQMLFVSSKVDF